MKKQLHIAAVQSILHWEDPQKNKQLFEEKIKSLNSDVDLLVLPEMFTTGFSMNVNALAEPSEEDSTGSWMESLSKKYNLAITGSVMVSENGKVYNRLIWVDPDGNRKIYNKRHLFRMADEDKYYTAGEEKVVVDFNGWKICPFICYDLRFPVWSRNEYYEKGNKEYDALYDLLIYVANWPSPRKNAWETLLRARAIENQCFVVGVNRVGMDGNAIHYNGDSAIIDFKGNDKIVSQGASDQILTSIINIDDLIAFRKKFPVGLDAD